MPEKTVVSPFYDVFKSGLRKPRSTCTLGSWPHRHCPPLAGAKAPWKTDCSQGLGKRILDEPGITLLCQKGRKHSKKDRKMSKRHRKWLERAPTGQIWDIEAMTQILIVMSYKFLIEIIQIHGPV